MYKVAIITLSDRAYANLYEDKSGKYLVKTFEEFGFEIVQYRLIDDDPIKLKESIVELQPQVDLIVTTGGTGLTSKDITVGVVETLIDYEVRGMTIALHQFNLSKSAGAMFSRALCGVLEQTMIITLPGSYKAVVEISNYLLEHLSHGLGHLHDSSNHS